MQPGHPHLVWAGKSLWKDGGSHPIHPQILAVGVRHDGDSPMAVNR